MSHFRFRIGSMLILIAFLGVGFAALREASDIWDSIVLTLTIGVLFVSLLLAIHRRDERRAFWVAFALFGWGYLGLTAQPTIEHRLPTARLLTYLDSRVTGRPVMTNQAVTTVTFSSAGTLRVINPNSAGLTSWSMTPGRLLSTGTGTTENFVRIGHSLLALILAWLGGGFSRRLDLRSRRADSLPPSVEESGVE